MRRKIFSDVNSRLAIAHRKELEKEISVWKKKHSLDAVNVPKEEDENIENLSETLFLCYNKNVFTGKFKKDYFITDKNVFIRYRNGEINRLHISIDTLAESSYHIEEKFYKTKAVVERIKQIKGFSNFSLTFRNTEHVCRFILSGVWVSYQMTEEGVLRKIFEKYLIKPEHSAKKKLLNVLPENNFVKLEDSKLHRIFKEDKRKNYVSYKSEHDYLQEKSTESYNIVFIGPSGAGKRPLINHLFNKYVLPPVKPLTRKCLYIQGTYQAKPVCIVNTIGLNGEDLDPDQIISLNMDSFKENLSHIDKIVVIASERIELEQKNPSKKLLVFSILKKNETNFSLSTTTQGVT